MNHDGVVTSARITHETGSVDDISAAAPESQHEAVATLLTDPAVDEALVLSTCNRLEVYVVTPTHEAGRTAVGEFLPRESDAVTLADHEASLEHLLRVAAGLESIVLGEDQILGQVRTAYEEARAAGGIGPLLETAVTKALHVGERARTETAINDGVVSLGSAAVKLAGRSVDLAGAVTVVVGAGEMGRVVAHALASADVGEVVIANRTPERASDLAAEIEAPARGIDLSSLPGALGEATLVVTATASAEPVVTLSDLGIAEPVIVDLGQPRDVSRAVADSDVDVYDLDDLESVTEATREQRAEAARRVASMVEAEHAQLLAYLKRTRADEVIAAMYESAERIKRREVETAIARLEDRGEPVHDDIVESMADALVNQLLAPPTASLREAAADDDWDTITTAIQLFDPTALSEDQPIEETGSELAFGTMDDD